MMNDASSDTVALMYLSAMQVVPVALVASGMEQDEAVRCWWRNGEKQKSIAMLRCRCRGMKNRGGWRAE